MNTLTRPTDEHQQAAVQPATGPVARAIAGAVAAGLISAVGLVVAVFPGATEATVTGSWLLAFGFGWAVMGWATARFTGRPLRWTRVPAVAMTVTGAAVLLFAPHDGAMRTMAWIWPAPAVALAVYVWVQARRTVPRRGRWILTPVAAVLALAAVGAVYEDISVVRDQHHYTAPGTTYDVNGHRLYLDCRGHGSPTVVLSNGLGEVSASWTRIVDQVAGDTRVCAYDRAGQGWSDDVTQPQDGLTAAQDLHTLLRVAGEHGPYVLTGHSVGGTYALTYAARYPHDVAGLVLLDSSSPDQFTAMPAYSRQYALMRRGLALLPTLDRLGLGRATAALLPSHLPQPAADVVTSLTASAHGARNGRDELSMLPTVFAQARALTSFGDRPLAVLTSSENLEGTAGWGAAQDRLAALSTDTVHRVVDSSHPGLLGDRGPAQQSADAVEQVVRAIRSGSPVTGR